MEHLISIIIPAYNAERYIEAALNSCLAQDHLPLEVIVVDDGSTDATAAIANNANQRVRCIRQENAGAPAARNRGLCAAQGAFVTFLDADDIYEPGCLHLQMNRLMANPKIDIVIGRSVREQICSAPWELPSFAPYPSEDTITTHLSVCLFRRAVFERVGQFDEELRHCDDYDWFMRAREQDVPMLLHRDVLVRQRLHFTNLTRDRSANQRYLAMALRKSLTRRRAASGEATSLPQLSASLELVTNAGEA
jgi:glycosyltransferase involved in cell wall biosynthesis